MRKGFLIYEEMRKYLTIYEETWSISDIVHLSYTDKKENKIFLIYKEFRMEQLQSHL
jgi:hypothetical protein